MSSFIESCTCRGVRPTGLVPRIHHPRSDLIARLLKERRVARFVIAPDGFGKTALAYAYADIVFSFNRTFWINARSPCFLRDLDAGVMASAIRRFGDATCLVVFEDLPRLDDVRARLFSQLVDVLLEWGNEVVITCAPSSDAYGGRHQDRLAITGRDLLLTDDEVRVNLRGESLAKDARESCMPAERVACLRWKEDGQRDLALGIRREELPADLLLAILVMLLLRQGSVDDLKAFLPAGGKRFAEMIHTLEEGYPYVGVVSRDGLFATAKVDVDALHEAVSASFESLARASSFKDRDTLTARLADALVARGEHDRAVGLMLTFSTKVGCGAWLVHRGWQFVDDAAAFVLRNAHAEITRSALKNRPSLNVIVAWASLVLADSSGACGFARRVAFNAAASPVDRALACVILLREGPSSSLDRAREALRMLLCAKAPIRDDGSSRSQTWLCWRSIASLALAFDESPAAGLRTWMSLCDGLDVCEEGHDEHACEDRSTLNALLLGASWLFEDLISGRAHVRDFRAVVEPQEGPGGLVVSPTDVALVAKRVTAFVESELKASARLGWCGLQAALRLKDAARAFPSLVSDGFSSMTRARISGLEARVVIQQEGYRKSCEHRDAQLGEYLETHPDAFRDDARNVRMTDTDARAVAPMLHVSLFGSLEVRIGDEVVESGLIKRQKTKALLAILVLNRGREVSRDRLAAMLWPTSSADSARKSLYTTYTQLRKALTVGGSCPYLVRDQHGCRINTRLVTSDVSDFEALCRTLMFSVSENIEWEQLYTRVEELCSDDLLPGERENEVILTLREKYRTQLVDALIAATRKLIRIGETQGALWFAREALHRDRTREDVYAALMEAQIAADQRGGALETFFACRTYLSENLGIDPSPRIVMLYRSIIETEESF